VETVDAQSAQPRLVGIGGWLTFVAIGQVVGPLRVLVNVAESLKDYGKIWEASMGPTVVVADLLLNAVLALVIVRTSLLFFGKRRAFKEWFVWQWIATLVTPLLSVLVVRIYLGPLGKDTLGQFAAQWIVTAIVGLIWIAYVMKSRRVANTMVN
jgi:hypothetical protein